MPAPTLRPTPNRLGTALRRPGVGLIRWVMLWFALSLGVAVASPLVHPQTVELVCSNAGSLKAIVHTDDGAQEMGAGHMDCPLCVVSGAPPATTPTVELPTPMPVAHVVQPIPSAHIAAATAAPLPARGPPSLL